MFRVKRKCTQLAWRIWQMSCQKDMRCFEQSLKYPEQAQRDHLKSILRNAEGTNWARKYGLSAQSSLKDFRQRVPVQEPASFEQWTDRIRYGQQEVLTQEPVERLVPTSGTTGQPKLIPMTQSGRQEFSQVSIFGLVTA